MLVWKTQVSLARARPRDTFAILQGSDTVGWETGRASGQLKVGVGMLEVTNAGAFQVFVPAVDTIIYVIVKGKGKVKGPYT